MNFKKLTAAALAAATALIPLSSSSLSAFVSTPVYAETHGMGAALPEWIPSNYETALDFRNTYGATHIQNGLICIVFKEHAEKVPEGEPQGVLRYEIRNTQDMMEVLCHSIYGSENSEYCYEVVVYYAPKKEGDFEAALVDTWIKSSELDLGYNHAIAHYTFSIDENKEITETDIYGWLPDCITEYKDYSEKYGKVSARDNYVVFCLDSNAGTRYQWSEASQSYAENLRHIDTVNCSAETEIALEGGAIHNAEVYQAEKDGITRIEWDYGIINNNGSITAEKTLIADCTITNSAQNVTLDNSFIADADFYFDKFSIYSGELTANSEEIYSKFAESKSAVITSQNELKSFLSAYLKENALKNFIAPYNDSFFEKNVLLLNTYLDPYMGRILKHSLNGVYYKDDRLVIDIDSVINANRMRTSYFTILETVIPKSEYKDSKVEWRNSEVLDYDLKRISVIDENTGKCIDIPWDSVNDMFGSTMKNFEGSNPYYWNIITAEWLDLNINEKYLPEGYELSKTSAREIKDYGRNNADIIFKVRKTASSEVKYKVDKITDTEQIKLHANATSEYPSAAVTSTDELVKTLSNCVTEDVQKKYLSAYDEAFFKDNVLLINYALDSSGEMGRNVRINDSVVSDSSISVYYTLPCDKFAFTNDVTFIIYQTVIPKTSYNGQKVEWKAMGDTNGDGFFNISDVVTMQKWLLGNSSTKIADNKSADLCADGVIDVFDLTALRKLLLSASGISESTESAEPLLLVEQTSTYKKFQYLILYDDKGNAYRMNNINGYVVYGNENSPQDEGMPLISFKSGDKWYYELKDIISNPASPEKELHMSDEDIAKAKDFAKDTATYKGEKWLESRTQRWDADIINLYIIGKDENNSPVIAQLCTLFGYDACLDNKYAQEFAIEMLKQNYCDWEHLDEELQMYLKSYKPAE